MKKSGSFTVNLVSSVRYAHADFHTRFTYMRHKLVQSVPDPHTQRLFAIGQIFFAIYKVGFAKITARICTRLLIKAQAGSAQFSLPEVAKKGSSSFCNGLFFLNCEFSQHWWRKCADSC